MLALRHRGGGPVHINLETNYSRDFSIKQLPSFRVIKRISLIDDFPEIETDKIGIFVGSHRAWSKELTDIVDRFCETYNGVVFCDHTSNYFGNMECNLILFLHKSTISSAGNEFTY